MRTPERQHSEPLAAPAGHGPTGSVRAVADEASANRQSHTVQFYEDDDYLCDSVARYIAEGLEAGEPVVVVATAPHRAAFADRLARDGVDVVAVRGAGRLVWLDAHEMLSKFMVGGQPDWALFDAIFGEVLDAGTRSSPTGVVRAYGEMVDVLWRAGNKQAALRLEDLWNRLASRHPLSLLCAYVMGNFYRPGDAESFRAVCDTHSHVLPTESYQGIERPDGRLREISELQQRARSLEHEIEQRKELEVALRAALEREKDAREEAERSVRYNEMFAGMLGHDLRNPLSAITTGANYIARLNSSQKSTRAATRILASAERMGRMIDQLLDFTRIRAGGGLVLTPTRVDLEELCCKVRDELEAANPERTIVVDVKGDTVGQWDHDRLLQVFSNLVGNALHHGSEAAPVAITCDGTEPGSVSVSVHNDGAVPPEVLPVLFEPFRGHARYQRTRGLGLGLFITQQIVAAHGGTIDVASAAGHGTTFHLGLPRVPPTRPEAPTTPPLH